MDERPDIRETENSEANCAGEELSAPDFRATDPGEGGKMTRKRFYRSVILLALPIAFQNLLTALLNIFDQMMVGWLPGGVADAALSAVLLANQVVFIFQIVIFAVANTVNIFIAQDTENGNSDRIKNRAGFTFAVILAVSTVFMLICSLAPSAVIGLFDPGESYRGMAENFLRLVSFSFIPMGLTVGTVFMLRAIKRLRAALAVNVCAVALNFCLNYLFMFGPMGLPAHGLNGAAYGTIASRSCECAAMAVVLFALRSPLTGRPSEMFRPDPAFIRRYFSMFFPILCNELFWVLAGTVYLYVYDKLPDSEVALASENIAQSLDKIVSVVMTGVGSAVGVVMSNIIGRGVRGEPERYARESMLFGLFTGMAVALLTLASAFVMPAVFSNVSDKTHIMARNLILLYALTATVRTLCFTAVIGVLRSGGDTTFCMIGETLMIWCASVPLVLCVGLLTDTNIYVLYLLSNVSEVLKLAMFLLRIRSDRWIKFRTK